MKEIFITNRQYSMVGIFLQKISSDADFEEATMDYFGMYRDVWQFHKKYIDKISPDDSFWQSVVADTDKLCKQYGECPFIRALVMNEVNEFERIYKEMAHGK